MRFLEAVKFIQKAHGGQTDKAGVPYWRHPYRVAMYYQDLFPDATENELVAALLHDVVEDTAYTFDDLAAMGVPNMVLSVLELVTKEEKPRTKTYLEWIEWIAESGNQTAIRVKLADIEDNGDPVRIAQLPYNDRGIIVRYTKARSILWNALKKHRE